MDNKEADALKRQTKDMTRQEAKQLLERLTLHAMDVADKLDLHNELNRQIALKQQTAELKRGAINQMMDNSVAKNIAGAGAGDYQKIAASQIELDERYYRKVLQQANFSFWWALIAAIIGLFFFLVASGLILQQSGTMANASLISGVVVEVISGIGFTLYAHASRQLASFHIRLDRTMLFLFANTVCEHIKGELKETTRAELVLVMANSPKLEVKKKTRRGTGKIGQNRKQSLTQVN